MGRCITVVLITLTLMASAAALALQNVTLPLPQGTTNHETPGLLCTPTKWSDIITFYLVNYVAHAATVLTRPGETSADYFASAIGSLLYPALGMFRGIEAVLSGAIFAKKDELRKAAKSSALCMVVRGKDWRPANEEVRNVVFKRAKEMVHQDTVDVEASTDSKEKASVAWRADAIHVSASNQVPIHIVIYSPPWLNSKFGLPQYVHRQIVHGRYSLPTGYQFAIVPSDTNFTPPADGCSTVQVSATHNIAKTLIAIVQAGFALSTLYRARGDQIEQFGFAAFGLTVTPHAVMSIINLVGNVCRPDYAFLYMVETSTMDEARRRGGIFEGAVARAQEESTSVCACAIEDAEDVEQVQFSEDDDQSTTATFYTVPRHVHTTTHSLSGRTPSQSQPRDSLQLPTLHSTNTPPSPPVPRTHPVNPLPPRQDYKDTKDDALLLLPCCDPLSRHTPPHPAPHYYLSRILLRKPHPPFSRRAWYTRFLASPSLPSHTALHRTLKYALTWLIALTPVIVICALSRFSPGSVPKRESSVWRNFVIQWLIVGVVSGISWGVDQEAKDASPAHAVQIRPLVRVLLYWLGAAPAVGAFVSVAQMLERYGVCVWVGD